MPVADPVRPGQEEPGRPIGRRGEPEDDGVDPLPAVVARRARRYREVHGRLPRLLRPRTFTEKINWRICFDRRDVLAPTCDKLAMKAHARGVAAHLVRIPRTHWAGTEVGELTGVPLPARWVLKPNHSCRRVLFGEGPADPGVLAEEVDGWVQEQYWRDSDEWAYRRARPGLLVEDFVGVPGEVPADLKVLVFDGVPRLISVHTARQDRQNVRLYTPEWEPVPLDSGYPPGPERPAPARLADMLAAAALLAAGYDMLRVDFYEHDGVLWFGELTPYPGAGLVRLAPELDELLGSWWTLPRLGRRGTGSGPQPVPGPPAHLGAPGPAAGAPPR